MSKEHEASKSYVTGNFFNPPNKGEKNLTALNAGLKKTLKKN